jgi:hypothetical protein
VVGQTQPGQEGQRLTLLAFELFLHTLLIASLLLQLGHPAFAEFC